MKYSIVKNNEIILLPREWRAAAFARALAAEGLSVALPADISGRVITVGACRIVPVETIGSEFDARTQTRTGPALTVAAEQVDEIYTVSDRPVAEVQAEMITAIRNEAHSLLSATDYLVTRYYEDVALVRDPVREIPADVATAREAIRVASNQFEADINAADLATLSAYSWTWPA